ncbi:MULTISPECIES: flagellar export protein FliJ [unclassified Acidovorax]|jgi:flagellar FliJ protein|uniref:flagellar export protein FliJ n=1 Tax=unclassified Acidovorax TaxID=2684926 RepID=UPI000B3F6B99|nr:MULTISPECIES: flagellar export protein FliJ [unclassified Acidovorax]
MSNLNALAVAVDVALRKRDEARRLLQDAQGAQQAAQDQLNQLQGYARETEGRWGMRADAAVQPEVMFHHYQFMDRLGHAAGLQTRVVDEHASRVQDATRNLLDAELRLASLRKVVEKRQQDHQRQQMRREQKQTDERASMQLRNSINGPPGREY